MRETEGRSTSPTAEEPPSLDLIFELLSDQRRRYVLYYLTEQPDGVATVDEVTDVVATRRAEKRDQEPETVRDQIRTSLQHVHLPKLEAAGLLEHDRRSETVRYWSQPSLEEWVEHAQYKEF